ncbi:MAG: RrF2 family transcriptional regulator [Eubacteriales bacterium]|nr:Rrf2 family transcriptional regulator [Clostridiales bacterium]
MISTRGRYAIRVMVDLAEHGGRETYTPMKQVAARLGLSLKYLEQILPLLTKAKYVEGIQGKGGGYRLCREPQSYRIGDILRVTEEGLAPVACLECGASPCEQASGCRTLPMWRKYYKLTLDYFDSIRLSDLMEPKEDVGTYVI